MPDQVTSVARLCASDPSSSLTGRPAELPRQCLRFGSCRAIERQFDTPSDTNSQDGSDSFKSASEYADAPDAAAQPESPAFASASDSGMPESPAAPQTQPNSAHSTAAAAAGADVAASTAEPSNAGCVERRSCVSGLGFTPQLHANADRVSTQPGHASACCAGRTKVDSQPTVRAPMLVLCPVPTKTRLQAYLAKAHLACRGCRHPRSQMGRQTAARAAGQSRTVGRGKPAGSGGGSSLQRQMNSQRPSPSTSPSPRPDRPSQPSRRDRAPGRLPAPPPPPVS